MTTKYKWFKAVGSLLMLGFLAACNQQPTSSQNISNCMNDPVCKTYIGSQSASPYGTLTPIGTVAQGPVLATTPALATSPATAAVLNASNGNNAFAKVAGVNAAVETGSASVAAQVQKNAASDTPSSAARVMSASQLGAEPTDGAAGAR